MDQLISAQEQLHQEVWERVRCHLFSEWASTVWRTWFTDKRKEVHVARIDPYAEESLTVTVYLIEVFQTLRNHSKGNTRWRHFGP